MSPTFCFFFPLWTTYAPDTSSNFIVSECSLHSHLYLFALEICFHSLSFLDSLFSLRFCVNLSFYHLSLFILGCGLLWSVPLTWLSDILRALDQMRTHTVCAIYFSFYSVHTLYNYASKKYRKEDRMSELDSFGLRIYWRSSLKDIRTQKWVKNYPFPCTDL